MQLLQYFVLMLSLINILDCKSSEKQNKNSLERSTANQQLGQKMELEMLNPNRTFHVKQFECFNISLAVKDKSKTGNNSNVEVRVCYRSVQT